MSRKSFCGQVWFAGIVLVLCATSNQASAQIALPAPTPATPQAAQPQSLSSAAAQDSVTTAKSPGDLYKEAMHPLDVVRTSLDNWSDAELGALVVGMHNAAEDCAKAKPSDYTGNDLYDLARLCTFGQDWNNANTVALDYVASRAEEHRTQAYALSVNALVHINAIDVAVQTAREMLRRLPYDAEAAYAVRGLKNFLEESSNPIAATLAADEHPMIVEALRQGVPLKATHGDAVIGVGALYESAMQLAFLDRYAGNNQPAAAMAAEVEGALPVTAALSAEDRQQVDAVSARYRLLGSHLPVFKVLRSLQSPGAKAQIDPNLGVATVLVLFPDWCVQCKRMMKPLTEFAAVNRDTPIHAYGLVFADEAVVSGQAAHEANFKEMQGTQTLVVPATTAQSFGATDFPLGIVVDPTGAVRFISPISGDAFNGDSYIGKVIVRMVSAFGVTLKRSLKAN